MKSNVLGRTDLHVSQIGLGTAEIGFPYGLNAKDFPTNDTVAENFLREAAELGITYFDTARYYQEAEKRIAESGITKITGIVVGTKCANFLEKGEDPRGIELEKRIREEVEASLKALGVEILQLLYFHGPSKEQIERGELIEIMRKLKEEGKVQWSGISTRGEEAPLTAIKNGFFDVIQVAYSILDQRMTNILEAAKRKNIGVVNRSVFLKGALTPAGERLPDELAPLKENSRQAAKIANRLGITLPELALRFSISNPAVSVALIGTSKIGHLQTAIKSAETGPLPENIINELKTLAISDPDQVDPARWPPLD